MSTPPANNGTRKGSWLGNRVRGSTSIVTGSGKQMVFFDWNKGKFLVDVNRGIGKQSFQVMGKDADELKRDYDAKLALNEKSSFGKMMGTKKGGRSRTRRSRTRRN